MFFRATKALAALALAAVTACAGRAPVATLSELDDGHSSSGVRANVLTASQLRNENGSLLDAMTRRLFTMSVDNRFQCPAITLRGNTNTVPGITEPEVFVDGMRSMDTCILRLISATDVSRVEVYPSGFTDRPGYSHSSHGLILVFTRRH